VDRAKNIRLTAPRSKEKLLGEEGRNKRESRGKLKKGKERDNFSRGSEEGKQIVPEGDILVAQKWQEMDHSTRRKAKRRKRKHALACRGREKLK